MEAKQVQHSWWQKLIAAIALLNLILVLFNLSYLACRDFYFNRVPLVVAIYDPIKAIEPHPDTEKYLQTSDRAIAQIKNSGLTAENQQLLASLRQQSTYIVAENPFLAANKSKTFAKVKRRMEYRLQTRSAKVAFNQFWSPEYLSRKDLELEFTFFQQKIQPLLKTNYYRQIDANGMTVDYFWRIDLVFAILFALDYLIRNFRIAQERNDITWSQALLRSWYDALLFIPVARWLRFIPVIVKIHRSGLFNLEKIVLHLTHEPVAYLSHRVTTFLIVRLLNQSQAVVADGAILETFLSSEKGITVGETAKIDKISDRLINLTIYRVLPEIQPDLEHLLRYSLQSALKQSDLYQAVRGIPGLADLPQETIEQLADYLAQTTYDILANSYTDTEGKVIFNRLSNNFARTLKQQIQDQTTQLEIQTLLSDLLEEWKLNYIKNFQQRDPEQTLTEAERLKLDVLETEVSSHES